MQKRSIYLAVAAAALLAAVLVAQTQLGLTQIAAIGDGRVLAILGNRLRQAALSGLTLTEVGGQAILTVTGAQAPGWRREQLVPSAAAPTFRLAAAPVAGSVRVSRNGLDQWEGDDYTVTGSDVSMPFAEQGDRVVIQYQAAPPVPAPPVAGSFPAEVWRDIDTWERRQAALKAHAAATGTMPDGTPCTAGDCGDITDAGVDFDALRKAMGGP